MKLQGNRLQGGKRPGAPAETAKPSQIRMHTFIILLKRRKQKGGDDVQRQMVKRMDSEGSMSFKNLSTFPTPYSYKHTYSIHLNIIHKVILKFSAPVHTHTFNITHFRYTHRT